MRIWVWAREQRSRGRLLAHMRSGGFASYTQVLVCVAHPTAEQRALVTLARAPHTVAAGQSAASGLFAASAVTDPVPVVTNGLNAVLSAAIPALIIACGLLTLARVIRLGAEMNEDLAGTV